MPPRETTSHQIECPGPGQVLAGEANVEQTSTIVDLLADVLRETVPPLSSAYNITSKQLIVGRNPSR